MIEMLIVFIISFDEIIVFLDKSSDILESLYKCSFSLVYLISLLYSSISSYEPIDVRDTPSSP